MERLLNSRFGLTFVTHLARIAPPWLGRAIASQVATWVAPQRDLGLVRAVRSNQWVVMNEKSDKEALDQAVRAVIRNSARSIYDLYHNIQNLEKVSQMFIIEPSFQTIIDRHEYDQRGLIVTGLHMNGFDLALQWICMKWCKPMALTIPDPAGGRQLEFEIRRRTGINLVPASIAGLRKAIRHLQQGGTVVTGIDRPIVDCTSKPLFFGREASLPSHHITLALKAQVPAMVVFSHLEADGKYHLVASPPIEMDHYPSRAEDLRYNTEKVLAVAEVFIRQAPQQWIMPLPVWPEIVNQVPR